MFPNIRESSRLLSLTNIHPQILEVTLKRVVAVTGRGDITGLFAQFPRIDAADADG